MTITRMDVGSRFSEIVIHDKTVYLAGQVGNPGDDVAAQTRTALENIDRLLQKAGSSKEHILSATIWLADIKDYNAMNQVWDAWRSPENPPARATSEAKLASPDYRVEIIIIAARA
jgi:enamine deaminase RidA (YjgF/YER057c/UK114 family)